MPPSEELKSSPPRTAIFEKVWLRLAVLVVAAFVVHLPSLQGELIWDDNYLLGENPFFRSPIFSLEVFRHYLYLDSISSHYRPVQNLSYMLDYLIWNGDVYGYHLSSVLWHAAAGALLYLLLRKLLVSLSHAEQTRLKIEAGAFLVALVWVLHPVHSAAVDYISGRADSLAFAFCAGAWLTYLRGTTCIRMPARAGCYGAAVFLFLLGLCSREIAAIWAAIFVLHVVFFRADASLRHRSIAVLGCVLALGAYAALRQLPAPRDLQPIKSNWDSTTKAGLMLRALGDYARVTVLPTNLHMERSVTDARMYRAEPAWQDRFSFSYLTVLGAIAAAALLAGALKRGRGRKLRIFGALWFVFGFLPISNLFELNATAAEHWLYLPLAGLLLVCCGWLIELPARAFKIAAAVTLVLAAALGVRSTIRSSDWVTAQIFYERTIAASGWSPRVGLNLAIIYSSQGRLDPARQLLERTLKSWPEYPLARSHLAIVLAKQGAREQSDRLLNENAELAARQQLEYPRTWAAAMQLARRALENQREDEALRLLAIAREREPNVWPVAEMEVEILRRTRGPEAALPIVQRFTDSCWWQYPAFLALGKLKAQQGDAAGALAALKHASRLDIRETEALNLMTRIQLNSGNLEAALGIQERAISRQPDQPSQHLLYSEVLMQMGRAQQAQRARDRAESLQQKTRGSA